MRDNYDFSQGVKNPYAAELKNQAFCNPNTRTEDNHVEEAARNSIPVKEFKE